MSALTAKRRNRLSQRSFAVPKGSGKKKQTNSYPIDTKNRARNALARVSQHGTPAEKKKVRRAVATKYPSIGGSSSASGTARKRGSTSSSRTSSSKSSRAGSRRKRRTH